MTVDGVWSAIGSSNFDNRSFKTNEEIMLGICDRVTAQKLDMVFDKYAPKYQEIKLEAWQGRGLWHELKDNVFYMLHEIL